MITISGTVRPHICCSCAWHPPPSACWCKPVWHDNHWCHRYLHLRPADQQYMSAYSEQLERHNPSR